MWSWSLRENVEEREADQAGKANLPAVKEAGAGARRMTLPEVRLAGEPPGPPPDQEKPAGK
jgi:hypothetical protein